MADADYCELCDLPLSQCVHGRPAPVPPPPPPPAPRAPRAKATPRVPGSSAATVQRSAPRKWTSPDELRPAILSALRDADGELEGDEVFVHLEVRIGDRLRPGDRETNPQGELRWRAAAHRARKSLMDDGLLEAAPGVWRLTALGASTVLPQD